MADHYVKKTGNDSTGDGSSGNPYLTIEKALSVVTTNDRVLVGAGTYSEYGLATPSAVGSIKICTLDDFVTIDGSGGDATTTSAPNGNGSTVFVHNNWVIDGSTGSATHNLEIIGAGYSCIRARTTTVKSSGIKYCILSGRGDRRDADADTCTEYGTVKIAGNTGNGTVTRNSIFRNFWKGFNYVLTTTGEQHFRNNIFYNCGPNPTQTTTLGYGLYSNSGDSTMYFNTICDFTGTVAMANTGNGSKTKNNNCAFNSCTLATIYADGESGGPNENFSHNNAFYNTSGSTPSDGNYKDFQSTAILDSNLETDPIFLYDNPWHPSNKNDFSLWKKFHHPGHYPSNTRLTENKRYRGSHLHGAGVNITGITTDFSGATRPIDSDNPTIGAMELNAASNGYFWDTNTKTVADSGNTVKVKKDFTLNHYNRLKEEHVRNAIPQVPFGLAIKGPPTIKDKDESYKLTRKSK